MTGRGLHHVTVIATDCTRNLDFYTRVLGLRLVKRTVTHEDPGAYHLFYGSRDGAPGDRLSFFSWRSVNAAIKGAGEGHSVSFAIPPGATAWWKRRLGDEGFDVRPGRTPFGQEALAVEDPDGTQLWLVAADMPGQEELRPSPGIPPEFALRGLLGVTLEVRTVAPLAAILENVLGFAETGRARSWLRLAAHSGPGGEIWLHESPERLLGRLGAGTVHHIAFRARDEADQARMAELLKDGFGIPASVVKDRTYFRSIYFRSPDGILVEISTDGPGFLIDEAPDELGRRLMLPPELEPLRQDLLLILPPLS